MEEWIKLATIFMARVVEGIAAFIIAVGALRALVAFGISMIRGGTGALPPAAVRLSLGRTLALALEFLLGADILKTAIAPTWNDIGQLAAIATLRTALNYFLERELHQGEEPIPRAPLPGEAR